MKPSLTTVSGLLSKAKLRILVLSKRQCLGKDLLSDRFWRLYEIPQILAQRGHKVTGLLLSYRTKEEGSFVSVDVPNMHWQSVNARLPYLLGMSGYFRTLEETLEAFHPDIVWASSDVLHAVFAWIFCRMRGIPFVVDLYDNYESFGLTKLPGMTKLLRAACRAADGLTVVSHPLDEFIASNYGVTGPRQVIRNAVPNTLFYPRNKHEARDIFGLPSKARLIGTAGAITRGRGIEVLFQAFLRLTENDPDLWLVLAGPRDETPKRFPHPRIIDLGLLEPERVPLVINALDVAVICNLDSDFGRYCFPQKFYEIVSCGVPLVAAEVGELKTLLSSWPDCLYPVNSVDGLADKILRQLTIPVRPQAIFVPTWADEADKLERFFTNLISPSPNDEGLN